MLSKEELAKLDEIMSNQEALFAKAWEEAGGDYVLALELMVNLLKEENL